MWLVCTQTCESLQHGPARLAMRYTYVSTLERSHPSSSASLRLCFGFFFVCLITPKSAHGIACSPYRTRCQMAWQTCTGEHLNVLGTLTDVSITTEQNERLFTTTSSVQGVAQRHPEPPAAWWGLGGPLFHLPASHQWFDRSRSARTADGGASAHRPVLTTSATLVTCSCTPYARPAKIWNEVHR
jgi:hypothetical protein